MDDSVQFFAVLVVGQIGKGWVGGWFEWSLCDGVDFLDGVEERFDLFGCCGCCGEDWGEILFGLENVVDGESAAVVFHFLGVDVNQRQNILDGPAFAVLVFGDEIRDFDSCARVEVFAEDAADATADA